MPNNENAQEIPPPVVAGTSWFRSTVAAMNSIVTGDDDEGAKLRELLLEFQTRFDALSQNPPIGIERELVRDFFGVVMARPRLFRAFVQAQVPAGKNMNTAK